MPARLSPGRCGDGWRGRGCGRNRLRRWRRYWCLKLQQFRNGDELESFRFQLRQCRRHCLDGLRVDIMGQDDRPGTGFFQNAAGYDTRTRIFPIEWIDFPQNNFVTEFVMNETLLVRRNRTVRRSK